MGIRPGLFYYHISENINKFVNVTIIYHGLNLNV